MKLCEGIIDVMCQTYFDGDDPILPLPKELLRDKASRDAWPTLDVVSHLFGDAGARRALSTSPSGVINELIAHNVHLAQIPLYPTHPPHVFEILTENADRFFASLRLNPHDGYDAVAALDRIARAYPQVRSVSMTPSILNPQIPPNSKEFFPIYAKCIELDIPVQITVGFAGPRVPSWIQDPMYLDEVLWFFPDLRIVMKHGGEPWVDICVRLMKKWPNLYYATTGFTPRRYPKEIIEYANRSGRDRIIYGGYFPSIGYDRIMSELAELPINDDVAPMFLRDNARAVYKL